MTLPNASRTACEVKFSEGIRLIKCFCRLFSYRPQILSIPKDIQEYAQKLAGPYFLEDFEYLRIRRLEVGREQLEAYELLVSLTECPSSGVPSVGIRARWRPYLACHGFGPKAMLDPGGLWTEFASRSGTSHQQAECQILKPLPIQSWEHWQATTRRPNNGIFLYSPT